MFSSISSNQASLPTFVRCKPTQRGPKVQNIRQQEPSTKSPVDVNVTVKARHPAPTIAPVFVGRFAAQEAALKVEAVEQVLTPVSLARAQRQTAIALDCLEGKRPENLATSSDWETLLFLEDIGEMTTAVPVVRSAFSVYVSRFRKFVDEI